MSNWQDDKKWSDQYMTEIKRILGEHLIGVANVEEDALHNTDLITLRMDAMRIACRVRTKSYYHEKNYKNEFTLRCSRPSGNKTELEKVMEGWGDFFFYGFGDEDGKLIAWTLGDLRVFREWFMEMKRRFNCTKGTIKRNNDGSSDFAVFEWSDVPSNMIVAQHLPTPVIDW
jgi:hypothetical protein